VKFTLFQKIYGSVLLVLTLAVLSASVVSIFELQHYYKQQFVREMNVQLDAVEHLLAAIQPDFKDMQDYAFFVEYAQRQQYRLTLNDSSGTVLFDSNVPQDSLIKIENHLDRQETLIEKTTFWGRDKRKGATLHTPMFYTSKKCTTTGDVKMIRVVRNLKEVENSLQAIQRKILFGGGLAVLLFSIIIYVVAFRITYPIHQLARAAERIKSGDYSVRFADADKNEIGCLANLLNEILNKMNSDLVQMKKLEHMRSQFLGNVSHELRTPIFSVQGYLETLLNNPDAGPGQQKKFVKKAYRQAIRLNNLLTDLIDISRIESGEMKLTFISFDLHKWLQSIIVEATETATENNVEIIFVNEKNEHIEIVGDQERLRQVMHNLVTNAIKYNIKNGKVKIGYIADTRSVEIYVSDTGRGIDQAHIPHIFERFYRVDKERSREVGGTGLGLAIVKHILEAHNSKIVVTSQSGIGSRFNFSLTRVA